LTLFFNVAFSAITTDASVDPVPRFYNLALAVLGIEQVKKQAKKKRSGWRPPDENSACHRLR